MYTVNEMNTSSQHNHTPTPAHPPTHPPTHTSTLCTSILDMTFVDRSETSYVFPNCPSPILMLWSCFAQVIAILGIMVTESGQQWGERELREETAGRDGVADEAERMSWVLS